MRRISWLGGTLVLVPLLVDADPERTVLTGKVVDPSGAVYAKARIVGTMDFYDPDNKSVAERFPASGYVVAADGTFVVREGTLRAGAKTLRYRTTASAEGYSTSDEVVSVPIGKPGYAPAVVKLRPGVEHQLRVIDDTTKAPIATALVTTDCTTLQQRAQVGPDGTIKLRGCDDRNRNPMMAEAAGYQIGGINPDYGNPVETISLSKFRPLRLHVVDGTSGAAVAGCDLTIQQTKRPTDARGIVEHVATYGTVIVTPSCAGYGANLDTVYSVGFGPADAAATHELKLRHNFAVDGTVVDGRGAAVGGVGVEVRPVNERTTAQPLPLARTVTDKAGRFHFDSFSADTFVIYVNAPRWGSASKQIVWANQKGPIALVAKVR
jgi:hypothetical protein